MLDLVLTLPASGVALPWLDDESEAAVTRAVAEALGVAGTGRVKVLGLEARYVDASLVRRLPAEKAAGAGGARNAAKSRALARVLKAYAIRLSVPVGAAVGSALVQRAAGSSGALAGPLLANVVGMLLQTSTERVVQSLATSPALLAALGLSAADLLPESISFSATLAGSLSAAAGGSGGGRSASGEDDDVDDDEALALKAVLGSGVGIGAAVVLVILIRRKRAGPQGGGRVNVRRPNLDALAPVVVVQLPSVHASAFKNNKVVGSSGPPAMMSHERQAVALFGRWGAMCDVCYEPLGAKNDRVRLCSAGHSFCRACAVRGLTVGLEKGTGARCPFGGAACVVLVDAVNALVLGTGGTTGDRGGRVGLSEKDAWRIRQSVVRDAHDTPAMWVVRPCPACPSDKPAMLQVPSALAARGGPVGCPSCMQSVCARCNVPWTAPGAPPLRTHEGVSCDAVDAARAALAAPPSAEQLSGLGIKACPHCRALIEKNDGCLHMTCRTRAGGGGCGKEFCWDCLADWEPIRRDGMHRHSPNCRWYAGR
jgi:hypothetical protein